MRTDWLTRQLLAASLKSRILSAWDRRDIGLPELWINAEAVHKELRRGAREPETDILWEVNSSLASDAECILRDTFKTLPGIDLDVKRISLGCGVTVFLLQKVELTNSILESSFDLYISQTAHLLSDISERSLKNIKTGHCKPL